MLAPLHNVKLFAWKVHYGIFVELKVAQILQW